MKENKTKKYNSRQEEKRQIVNETDKKCLRREGKCAWWGIRGARWQQRQGAPSRGREALGAAEQRRHTSRGQAHLLMGQAQQGVTTRRAVVARALQPGDCDYISGCPYHTRKINPTAIRERLLTPALDTLRLSLTRSRPSRRKASLAHHLRTVMPNAAC